MREVAMRSWGAMGVVVALACGGDGGTRDAGSSPLTFASDGDATSDASAGSAGSSEGGGTTTAATASADATSGDGGGASSSGAGSDDAGTTTDGGVAATCPPEGPQDCSPGPGHTDCAKIESCFAGQIATAVSATIMENPTWFEEVEGGTLVLDVDSFVSTVVDKMVAAGRCAIRDPNDALGYEVGVKHHNEFAESFRLVRSDGTARTGTGSYTATCTPAWF